MAEVGRKRSLDGDDSAPFLRKKMKLSDLPLTQAQRSAIDNLVQKFRKKGEYDAIRSLVRSQYESGPAKAALLTSLEELVDRETDHNPSLLSKPPAMAATLVEGAGERSDIYKPVNASIEDLLNQFMDTQGLAKMREYRIDEIGAEVAAEEEQRGSKSEEDWAREADTRRQERASVREKELEQEREREKEERARKEERRRREREEDEAREKERQEREERRRKEREEREKEEEERRRQDRDRIEKEKEERRIRRKREDEEREAEREARLKRIRDEDRERERRFQAERDRSRDRYRSSRARSRTPDRDRHRDRDRDGGRRTRSRSPEPVRDVKPEDIKVDDDLALQALLQESEEMKKSRQRPFLERSESLEPPLRKAHPPKSLAPRDPVAARLAAYDSKPQSPANKSPSKLETKPAASPVAATPSASKDEDTQMEDAPPIKSTETGSRSRWDQPPPLRGDQKSRGRTRSRSIARSVDVRKHSRSRSRGSRFDRRSSRVEDDRRSKRDDDRHSYRAGDDSRRRDRDDRDDRRLRRSPSRETHISRRKSRYESRSPSPADRRRERDRRRSRSRSHGARRGRDRSPPPRRRNRTRSRSPDGIDRYVPGGAAAVAPATVRKRDDSRERGARKREESRERGGAGRKRDDSRDRNYRSREYDRWDGDRGGRSRLQDSDRYLPGRRESTDNDRGRDRDHDGDRERDRGGDRDRGRGDRDRERRRRDRSRSRSRSRRRSRSRSRRR